MCMEEATVKNYRQKGTNHHSTESANATNSIIHNLRIAGKTQPKIALNVKTNKTNYTISEAKTSKF